MTERCTVQLHQGAQWLDVATVTLRDDPASGWRARVLGLIRPQLEAMAASLEPLGKSG